MIIRRKQMDKKDATQVDFESINISKKYKIEDI